MRLAAPDGRRGWREASRFRRLLAGLAGRAAEANPSYRTCLPDSAGFFPSPRPWWGAAQLRLSSSSSSTSRFHKSSQAQPGPPQGSKARLVSFLSFKLVPLPATLHRFFFFFRGGGTSSLEGRGFEWGIDATTGPNDRLSPRLKMPPSPPYLRRYKELSVSASGASESATRPPPVLSLPFPSFPIGSNAYGTHHVGREQISWPCPLGSCTVNLRKLNPDVLYAQENLWVRATGLKAKNMSLAQ